MQSTASSSTASSSRACQNCSKAKAKCISQSDNAVPGGQCLRCFRLERECIIQPKTTRKRRSPNMAKCTTQLEQKIESLVSLLSATQGTVLPSATADQPPVEPPQENHQEKEERRTDHQPVFSWFVNPPKQDPTSSDPQFTLRNGPAASSVTSTPYSSATPASTVDSTSAPSIDIEVNNADHLLKVFREFYEPDFPFIKIPPNLTAKELKARKPWLACTISMVASHENRNQQLAMARQIIMEAASALLLRCEKSLDLLEGLIIYNVWQYYYAPINPQYQSAAVMQLALAVLFDLGLNKPLRDSDPPDILIDTFRLAVDKTGELRRSLEERRAYVSCFIMTSALSCSLKRIDGLEPTSYLDFNCQILVEAAEFESDLILAFVARSQNLVSSTSRSFLTGGVGPDNTKAPLSMHAKSAKEDLQKFFMALPSHLQEHSLVRGIYHSAEIFIYEPSLHRSLFPLNGNSQRLDMLYSCLIAAKSLLDITYALPLSSYYGFSIITLSQLGYGVSTLFKLSFIEVPGWDLAHVRSIVNLGQYLEHFINNFAQVGAQIDNSQSTKVAFCTGCSRAVGRVKGWYDTRITAETEEKQQEERMGVTGLEDILGGEKFNYWDEAFFKSGDWEDMMSDFMQQ